MKYNFKKIITFMVLSLAICFAKAQADSITVYLFLSESCPICQSVTIELKKLYAEYNSKGIGFVGLFPNATLSDEQTRKAFAKKYNLPFVLKEDKRQQLTQQYGATTTPQVFVVRNSDGVVLYSGKVDNSFEALGKKRQVTTEHYLQKALNDILSGRTPDPAQTAPVGCFISKQ